MEIWPQGTPFYKVRGFSAALQRAGVPLASDTASYSKVGVQVLTNPALAWAVCYGYRPKLLIVHLSDWVWTESLSVGRARAADAIVPFVMDAAKHQGRQNHLCMITVKAWGRLRHASSLAEY